MGKLIGPVQFSEGFMYDSVKLDNENRVVAFENTYLH